ncbi:Glycosyltransferase, catalytic subunit of cellulose synthase and poly-beta-1,6-N-acetylglucosamine synthase [Jatrophihabitans endophyticus]|uniref:Glycosyltransferase, catalytic subunit of cellulose synthase and poly-beta-1,6-N-acetylglucosamine synthase n=1 Tax=Jatrophihabitans endophyticus TaxID=1206085 RepID=A0A1M5SWR9_9ACTN|nr:glycosyltransferase [Jatrophihabitans endophyticus]SHH42936.1 Glycosyltransferase, catalytic subunit of cellulose synthase and poly-beta-1,6-N-acetylglucosamine synthase [Jatrophihabitans endophyticus]
MDSPVLGLALLNTAAFLLCVTFLVYVGLIMAPYLRRQDNPPGCRDEYAWHYIVPCLDEEPVVAGTVAHLVADFPEATFWCVDDGSGDGTGAVLARLAEQHPQVRLVSRRAPEARQGKGAALNAAWRAIAASVPPGVDRDKVVVGVLDADARLDRWCPDVICGPAAFGDPEVSAVQIQVRVTCDPDAVLGTDLDRLADGARRPTDDPLLVRLQDLEFSGPIAAMQLLRQRAGSVGMGGNGQFTRLSALDRIALEFGTPWHGALLEDFELGLHLLLTGTRTAYCHDTAVAQAGLTELRPLLRQRCRWAQGGMQCARYLRAVFCSPQVPLPAALEIAYYLYVPWSQLLGSVVFPAAIGLDVWYAVHTAGGAPAWWAAGAWGVLPLALLFGVLPHIVWGPIYRSRSANPIGRGRAVLLGVANVAYGYVLQAAVWWALARLLRRRRDWQKTSHAAADSGSALATVAALPPAAVVPVARRPLPYPTGGAR